MTTTMVKGLFIIAAIYDGVLGLLFLFSPGLAFEMFEVVPPNHFGYVQFPAILLLIFAAMFYRVAMDPVANRFIMLYGVALKAGYSGIVFYLLSVLLSYSLYHLFSNTQSGSHFADKTRQAIALEQLCTHRTQVIVYAGGYFEIFETLSFVHLLLGLSPPVQARLRQWLDEHLQHIEKRE